MVPTDWAPSTRIGSPDSSFSSCTGRTCPVVHRTCESASRRVLGVTAARICSGSDGATTTRAPDAWSGPRRPKCSSVVVTISSSGPMSIPARTMLHASVVDAVRETVSASTPTSAATSARSSSRSASSRSKCAALPRPRRSPSSSDSRIASIVLRPRGPTLPLCRYANRSSTGNSARASSYVMGRF